MPAPTAYHRWLGWHAIAMRRASSVAGVGLIVGVAVNLFATWELAVVGGWDAAAITFLATVWPVIIKADEQQTEMIAAREDQTRRTATVLLLAASVASLLGVGFALTVAGRESGAERVVLIGIAVVTVVLSWTLVNTVYTLRYAHLQLGTPADGIAFGDSSVPQPPTYRDFAYVAFTIGMTYQVSDTVVRDRRTRVTVLSHALLSYLFGTVIVAGAINLIAGLVR
ncbi:MAG TPA: DUF1345 domain-containing protein [Actinomycetes bacterium]|nr:DUF1345 domain-containing protein [Actinomycetes bacterium]